MKQSCPFCHVRQRLLQELANIYGALYRYTQQQQLGHLSIRLQQQRRAVALKIQGQEVLNFFPYLKFTNHLLVQHLARHARGKVALAQQVARQATIIRHLEQLEQIAVTLASENLEVG